MRIAASDSFVKRVRCMRTGGILMAAAAFFLIFTDFFHFAFHLHPERPAETVFSVISVPGADRSGILLPDPESEAHASFCPVCDGILISDGPPLSAVGLPFSLRSSDPVFSGIDPYVSLSFLLPRGRAPPRAS